MDVLSRSEIREEATPSIRARMPARVEHGVGQIIEATKCSANDFGCSRI